MWRDNSGNPATVHKFKINTDEIYSLLCDYKTLLKRWSCDSKWALTLELFVGFRFLTLQISFLFVIFCFLTSQISFLFVGFRFLTLQISFLLVIFCFLTLQISFLFAGFRFLTLQISLDFVFVSFLFVSQFTGTPILSVGTTANSSLRGVKKFKVDLWFNLGGFCRICNGYYNKMNSFRIFNRSLSL